MGFKIDSEDRRFMEAAISEQEKCIDTPKVGAVIVSNNQIVARG